MNQDILIEQSTGGRDLARVRNLRYEILRKPLGMPFSGTLFPGDDSESTIHLLASTQSQLVGVASLLIDDSSEIQLRGMAVALEMQRQGVGRKIVDAAKQIARERIKSLWCNARFLSIGFYEREGWVQCGDFFDIPTIGPHTVMKWAGNQENNV
jgi:GNAT superfamily N-acetyltransferase